MARPPYLSRVVVTGASMEPTLAAGDRLLVLRVPRRWLRPGHLVALSDPRQPQRLLVKRVSVVTPGSLHVAGDNPGASTDSRHFGAVPTDLVRGRAVYRYAPATRRGWLWTA